MKKHWTRLLSGFLGLVMVLTLLPAQVLADEYAARTEQTEPQTAEQAARFQDVKSSDWFYEAVEYVYTHDLFKGTSANSFSPKGTMTRAMLVTVLGRIAQVDIAKYSARSTFSDVPEDAWYAPYVAWALELGITTGVGDGRFSPDEPVTRAQIAVFFYRYLSILDISLPRDGTKKPPADLETVPEYAREAVIALWQMGLLQGDENGNVNPQQEADRTQVATVTMRLDRTLVDTGVKTYPEAEKQPEQDTAKPSGGSSGGGSSGGSSGSSSSGSYSITLRMPDGTSNKVTQNTSALNISNLTTPKKDGHYFLGWYYDEACTRQALDGDTLTSAGTTLYPKMLAVGAVETSDTPYYTVAANVAETFTITVRSSSPNDDLTDKITFSGPEQFIASTGDSEDVKILSVTKNSNGTYTVSGPTEKGSKLAAGGSYRVVLEDDALTFDGQEASIREYHFTVEAGAPVMNLHLKDSVKEIRLDSISNIQQNGTQVASMGLSPVTLQAGGSAGTDTNTELGDDTGTFDSTDGSIAIGDTLAIYAGNTRPDERDETSDELDEVSYVTITNKEKNTDGTFTYAYTAATAEEVVFTPDVLPIQSTWDTDGSTSNKSITISEDNLTKAMSDVEADSLDAGDFLAFYTGDALNGESSTESSGRTITGYGCVTSWSEHYADGAYTYVIAYTIATEDDVFAAMDVTTENDVDGDELIGDLTEEELKNYEADIAQQAIDSGFAQAVAQNIAAAVSTMELSDLKGGEPDLSSIDLSGFDLSELTGQSLGTDGVYSTTAVSVQYAGESTSGSSGPEVEVKVKDVDIGTKLDHFNNMSGVRIALSLEVTITYDSVGEEGEALEITITPTFVQELRLSISTKGGAEWRWKWGFIPYIYDFYARVSVDMYTYTSINLNATIQTVSEGDTVGDVKDLVSDIQDLVDKLKTKLEGGNIEVAEGITDLQELYSNMLENDSEWVTLYRKSISQNEWVVAKIIKINLDVDFVVQANVNISLGLEFDYENAKRYVYNIYIFHGKATSTPVELVPESYNLQLYAMGVLGVRAGVETCLSVSLISKKVASVGVVVDVGAYLKVYGYVVYKLQHVANQPNESSGSGALYIEVGCYLDIGMDISAFNGKLSWKPTLLSKEWPLWSAGNVQAVTGFAAAPDEDTEDAEPPTLYMKKGQTTADIPPEVLTMVGFDLSSGKNAKRVYDLDWFDISFSDDRFSLTDDGKIKLDFGEGYTWATYSDTVSRAITCDMTITWKGAPMSFNTETIQLKTKVQWDTYEDFYNVTFVDVQDTYLDEACTQKLTNMRVAPLATLSVPTAPTRLGYTFKGWKAEQVNADGSLAALEAVPATMPDYDLRLTAEWEPLTNIRYTVIPMLQQPDGTYAVGTSYQMDAGRVDQPFKLSLRDIDGYMTPDIDNWRIEADGSSVIEVNYPRQRYSLVMESAGAILTASFLYGDPIDVPTPTRDGYTFTGWTVKQGGENGTVLGTMPTTMPTYDLWLTANWTANTDTKYTAYLYTQNEDGSYTLKDTKTFTGTTDTVAKTSVADTGTAGGTTFTLPTYSGYTLRENCRNITITIKGNGTASENYYYDLNRLTLTIHHRSDNSKVSETETAKQVGSTLAASTKTFAGYTLAGYYTDKACTAANKVDYPTSLTTDTTLYAKWTPNTVGYTVEHYQQALDGTYPATPTETETLSGSVDETVTPTQKTYDGFTTPDETPFTLKADAAENVIRYQYMRGSYQLKLTLNGGTSSDNQDALVLYGTPLTLSTPDRTGWSFDGWYTDSALSTPLTASTMPANSLTLYAKWTARDNISYTVEHWQQNAEGEDYTLADTENKTGTAGQDTAAEAKTYTGFTLTGSVTQQAIAGDGSTVVKLYYDRMSYQLTYTLNDENATLNGDNGTYRHGATVTTPTPTTTRAGYTFAGWFTDAAFTTVFDNKMPMSDTTLYAKWTAGSTSYTVKHYLQNPDGSTYPADPEDTDTINGDVDETVTPQTKTYPGFTAPTAQPIKLSANADENVVEYRYTRSQYTLSYSGLDDVTFSDGSALTDSDVYYGTAVTAPDMTGATRTGYTFGGWYTNAACTTELTADYTMPAYAQTLYAKWTPITYTLRFNPLGSVPLKAWLLSLSDEAKETMPEQDNAGVYYNHGIQYIDIPVTYGDSLALPAENDSFTVSGTAYTLATLGVYNFSYAGEDYQTNELPFGASLSTLADTDSEILEINIGWLTMNGNWDTPSTADNPAKIYNVAQLWDVFSNSINYYYPYSELMVDLEVCNQTTSAGSSQGVGDGCFDGNGHTIKALHAAGPEYCKIGTLDRSRKDNFTVKNVTLEGFTVTYAHSTEGNYNQYGCYGGLFGEVGDNFTLENVTVKDLTMTLTLNGGINEDSGTQYAEQDRVGGLIGCATGTVTLKDCTVTGTTMNVTLPENSTAAVGSLIGCVAGGAASVTIENCSFDSVDTLDQFGYVAATTPSGEENAA